MKLVEGQRVYVYYNLRYKCFSVRDVKTKRVVAHMDSIQLENVTFKVSQAGRKRVLREKQKNVHAGVQGYYTERVEACEGECTYNPYFYESFVNKADEAPLKSAEYVSMSAKKIYYNGGK